MILRSVLVLVFLLALTLAAVWTIGPREPADLAVTFDPGSIGADPQAYLARMEADIPNLRPQDAKEIVWAYPASRAKTPLAIVYIHGFSASKEEIRPVPDDVAQRLGANLFFTRLAGHGRDGAAMREPTVNDWINDFAEAVAIGRQIGERVVVIATSTGATLSTLGATVPGLGDRIDGFVLLSPNFRLLDRYAFVLDMPFAREFGPRLIGETRGFKPVNAEQAAHWTTNYPSVALLPMGALIRAARSVRFETMPAPAFFIYSPADAVVDVAATRDVASRWPNSQVLEVATSGDPSGHVLAGRILSPGTTEAVTERILAWIEGLPSR